ncbi:hypothetical protein COCSADRAFT_339106 [Bipolaris sorokiniana ND90Pr]|uniref:Zn(2)-C6 fungal-type domain-containing protein n=1 Tax=Cochliobolus sativus (strain ND90Pr / ATCC 201652) TaxID=665912 RepID=M2R8F2_COCSN|nr:uncharacterized protein COCSADRAFT_339106 [Bipolaris sorokiniana ND90Pr]EMD63219.1 hypothetical protein COCSADRAFT_339106 [Bipolaris sorokiniana ND90Pr]
MDDSNALKGQRARLTCTECYRRKIKCDKNVTCNTCIKRGYASFCTREDASTIPSVPPPAYQAQRVPTASDGFMRTIIERVDELESKLGGRYDARLSEAPFPHPEDASSSLAHSHVPNSPLQENTADAPSEPADTATVLEFLAWGRKKDAQYGSSAEHNSGPRRFSVGQDDPAIASNAMTEASRNAQLDIVEALLSSKEHLLRLVEYHNSSILWYHCSYSSMIFNQDLDLFFTEYESNVHSESLNLQWLGLLFAIITGSITCAPPSVYRSWGFSSAEKTALSKRWYEASVTCLNIACYIENHTIYSVQTIATLTIAAHVLGKSNSQSVLLASAGRVAQSLGLHRLGPEGTTAAVSQQQLRHREMGRRVFNQLCTQDWFQIPFSESYSLNPRFCQNAKLLNCNGDDMILQPLCVPTQASYCSYRYDIAKLMPQLLDAMAECNTLFTKYEKVLQYDEKMRKLATACMPTFLSTNAPVSNDWPIHVGWARRSLAICASHKIIMIHRKFLGLSFTNSAFSFTRRTCIAASKTILKEALSQNDERAPILWIEQAFSIAAGIILSLDALHRSAEEKEVEEHMKLVADTIDYLKGFDESKIASRGIQLLSALQREIREGGTIGSRKRPRTAESSDTACSSRKRARMLDVESFISSMSQNLQVTIPTSATTVQVPEYVGDASWDSFVNMLPSQTVCRGHSLFDDLLLFRF